MSTPSRFLVGLSVLLLAGVTEGQVSMSVRPDGRKVISNLNGVDVSGQSLAWLAKQRNRPSPYDEIVDRHAERWDVDPILVRAVMLVESGYRPTSVSKRGARGLMQLMPATARRFHVRDSFDPDENIRGGVQYLALLLEMFGGDLSRVLAAYNAGENTVLRYGGVPPYPETRMYICRALSVYHGRPWGGGSVIFTRAGGGEPSRLGGGFMSRRQKPNLRVAAASPPVRSKESAAKSRNLR